MNLPAHFKETPINRAMLGFEAEVDQNPDRFFNSAYIQGILAREREILRTHARTFAGLIFLNTLSLFYMQGLKVNWTLFGHQFQQIPASTEILCLFFGLGLFGFAVQSLDVMLFARIRYTVIHKLLGTDLTNIAIAHLKGNGIWMDLVLPRFIGYASGRAFGIFSGFFGLIMLGFIGSIFIASITTMFALYTFGLEQHQPVMNWLTIVSTVGVVMGSMGIILLIFTVFVKFKFVLPQPQQTTEEAQKAILPTNTV